MMHWLILIALSPFGGVLGWLRRTFDRSEPCSIPLATSVLEDDLKHLADPKCKKCKGRGRWTDYSGDEWGMVMHVRCDCTRRESSDRRKP